jgi:hypothetical protein
LSHISQPYKTVGKTTDLYNLTNTHGFVELDMILLMTKKAFRPFLQALVVRSVALKREFISGSLSKNTHFSVITQIKDKYQPNWLEKTCFA